MSYAKSITLKQAGTLAALLIALEAWCDRYTPEHGPRDMTQKDFDNL